MPEGYRYLSPDDVLAVVTRYMRNLGYAETILRGDGRSLLEMAVARAPNAAHYAGADLFDQAAALADGIALNHPFVDGNKRAALAALLTFLDVNGWSIAAEEIVSLASTFIALHEDAVDRSQADATISTWLHESAARVYEGP